MAWYAAHVIVAPVVSGQENSHVEAYENVFLVCSDTEAHALERAKELGHQQEIDDSLTVDGLPAKWIFLGVRKIVRISNPGLLPQDKNPPVDGTELTYSTQRFASLLQAQAFARGEPTEMVALD